MRVFKRGKSWYADFSVGGKRKIGLRVLERRVELRRHTALLKGFLVVAYVAESERQQKMGAPVITIDFDCGLKLRNRFLGPSQVVVDFTEIGMDTEPRTCATIAS